MYFIYIIFLGRLNYLHGPSSVLGEVTRERLALLREADDIMIQEITAAGIYSEIGQAFVVLLPVKSVGVMGDGRTYEQACAIRCVTTSDFMTADW